VSQDPTGGPPRPPAEQGAPAQGGSWGTPPGAPPAWPIPSAGGVPGASYGDAPAGGPSAQAVISLVLAILSWVACGCFTSLVAVFLARAEVNAIDRGQSPVAGRSMAQAAFWVALINVILYGVFTVGYFILAVVLAVLGK
jgi:hypothetical protein